MQHRRPVNMDRLLGHDMPDFYGGGATQDLFGIEVELEGMKIVTGKESIKKWWTQHQDGSLRANKPGSQAIEYVFAKPLNLDDTKTAIKTLFDFLNTNPGTEVFPSYRTSIHVHVNCLAETTRTVCNYITLAMIFDELFVSLNGDTRIANNFCLRTRDAEGQIQDLAQSIQQYGSFGNISSSHRYSSVNIGSLMKFGTIEFRSLECTTDYNRLIAWIELVQGLKEAARQYSDPREIISKFSRRGPLGFMLGHLGQQYSKYAAVPGHQEMLRNGMRLAQDFAYCSDWRMPTKEELDPKRKPGVVYNKKGFEQHVAQLLAAEQGPQPVQWGAIPVPAQQQAQFFNPMLAPAQPMHAIEEVDVEEPEQPDFEDDDDDF